jgi:hypothetical protein
MSIVTVHGPYMMYGAGSQVVSNAGGSVTPNQSNGLVFALAGAGDRAAADYVWTASGTPTFTPASGIGKNVSVTFATPGAKTITLTLGSSGGTTPAPGTYTFPVTAVSGPRSSEEQSVEAAAEPEALQAAPATAPPANGNVEYEEYDPGAHTVAEVVAEANDANDPDYTRALIDAERSGKNRVTLIRDLEDLLAEQC